MPTYSYECTKCSHAFDLFHAITADPKVKCPECGAKCRRLIGTGAGIIFKGSGFYETDYKRSSGSAAPSSGAKAKANGNGESSSPKAEGSGKETSSSAKSGD